MEQVEGRMSAGRGALVGLCEGSLIGMLFALLFGVFFNGPDFGGLLRYGIVTGGLLGTLFGALAHLTVSDGKRDFVSDTSIVAAGYDVHSGRRHRRRSRAPAGRHAERTMNRRRRRAGRG